MKKDRLVSRVEDGKHSLKYNLDVEDAVDTRVYDMSTTGKLPHMFPCHMEEDGGARIFTYKIGDKAPVQEFLKKEVNKPQMLTLLYNLLAGLEDFGLNMVSLSYVAKDVQYIYVTPENQEVSFVVVPVNKETTDLNEVRQLVKDIIAGARYFEMDRDNYVAKLISFLNRPGTFSLGDMKKYVEQMLLEIGIDIAAINKNKQEQIKAAEKANADAGKVSRLGVMMNNARMNENVQAPMPQNQNRPVQNGPVNFGQPAPMPQGQPGFGQAPMPGFGQFGQPAPMPQNQNRPVQNGPANFGQPAPMPQGQPGFGQVPMPGFGQFGQPAPMPQNQNRPVQNGPVNFGQPAPMPQGQPAPMPQGQPGFGQAPMPGFGQFGQAPMPDFSHFGQPAPGFNNFGQAPEEPSMPEAPKAPEMPPIPEAPKVPEMPPIPEAPKAPEMPPMPEFDDDQKTISADDLEDLINIPTPKSPEVPPVPEAPKAPEMPPIPEAPKAPEMPPMPEAPKAPDVPPMQNNGFPPFGGFMQGNNGFASGVASNMPPVSEAPVPPMPSMPVAPQTPAMPAMPEPPQVTEMPQEPQVTEMPQEPQMPHAEGLPKRPQMNEEEISVSDIPSMPERPVPYFVRKKTGEKIYIDKDEFVIGKSANHADYTIRDNTAVSRAHCIISRRNGVCYIRDNNSTNGTFINDQELDRGGERFLTNNVTVKLGDEEFVFFIR
jgi:hypothetical protein